MGVKSKSFCWSEFYNPAIVIRYKEYPIFTFTEGSHPVTQGYFLNLLVNTIFGFQSENGFGFESGDQEVFEPTLVIFVL